MTITRRTAAVVLLAVLAAGCTDDPATPDREPGDRLTVAQRRLAGLAGLAATASYDVTYDLAARSGGEGTIRIVAAPPSYRVDVALGGTPSTFIQRAGTVVSCTTAAGRASCFLVARPGEPVPDLFDPGVQRLFSDAVTDLAANPAAYAVDVVTPSASPGGRVECFDVRRLEPTEDESASSGALPTSDPTGFETGQYCFGSDGVLTRLAVSTGTLTLKARGPAPTASLFDPPATPVALPDLPSSSPTP